MPEEERMDTEEPRRTLTIGIVPGVMPDKWIHRWTDRMPDIPLRVLAWGEGEQFEVLRDGRVDMCFVRIPADPGPEKGREDLSVIPLYTELPVVVAPKEHELELYDDEVPAAELAAFTVLDPEEMGGAKPGVEVVASGAGVMVLPMSVARLYSRKDVISRVVTGHPQTRIGLAWVADRTDDVIEEFIGIVRGRTANSSRQPSARRDAEAKKEPKDAGARKESQAAKGSAGAKGGGAKGAKGRAGQQRQPKGRRPRRPGR